MALDCKTELLEVIEHEVLVEVQHEQLIESTDDGTTVQEGDEPELLIDREPEMLVVADGPQRILIDRAGRQGPPGPPGQSGNAYVEFPAALPLGGHRVVRLLNGQAIYADNTVLADANIVLGITLGAVTGGGMAQIQFNGLMTEPSWAWTPDMPVFCGTAGLLTQTPPVSGFSLIVGIAASPTQIFIGAKSPIVLQE